MGILNSTQMDEGAAPPAEPMLPNSPGNAFHTISLTMACIVKLKRG